MARPVGRPRRLDRPWTPDPISKPMGLRMEIAGRLPFRRKQTSNTTSRRCREAARATIEVVVDEELDRLVGAGPYERNDQRIGVRRGTCPRRVHMTSHDLRRGRARGRALRNHGSVTAPLDRQLSAGRNRRCHHTGGRTPERLFPLDRQAASSPLDLGRPPCGLWTDSNQPAAQRARRASHRPQSRCLCRRSLLRFYILNMNMQSTARDLIVSAQPVARRTGRRSRSTPSRSRDRGRRRAGRAMRRSPGWSRSCRCAGACLAWTGGDSRRTSPRAIAAPTWGRRPGRDDATPRPPPDGATERRTTHVAGGALSAAAAAARVAR